MCSNLSPAPDSRNDHQHVHHHMYHHIPTQGNFLGSHSEIQFSIGVSGRWCQICPMADVGVQICSQRFSFFPIFIHTHTYAVPAQLAVQLESVRACHGRLLHQSGCHAGKCFTVVAAHWKGSCSNNDQLPSLFRTGNDRNTHVPAQVQTVKARQRDGRGQRKVYDLSVAVRN